MLAQLLRRTIAAQMLFGAALGYGALGGIWGLLLGGLLSPALCNGVSVAISFARARNPGDGLLWWRALGGECLANLRFFLLRQPWTWAAPAIQAAMAPQNGEPGRVPVLLVHGIICNHRVWDLLIPALRAQGHTVLAINLEPLFTSIDDYALPIEQAVQSLCQHTGHAQVALVGHSMGGVAIRAWMRRYGTQQVAQAITLGSPHAGTRVRPLVDTVNGQQMAWQSPWLHALAATESEATRQLFRIGVSAQDNIVYPQREQTLQGVQPKLFEGLGHLQLCSAQEVRLWVCQQLALR